MRRVCLNFLINPSKKKPTFYFSGNDRQFLNFFYSPEPCVCGSFGAPGCPFVYFFYLFMRCIQIFLNFFCSKFISDIVMSVSSAMSMRERSSESARFEVLSDEHR